jgi:TonB-dependent receptor
MGVRSIANSISGPKVSAAIRAALGISTSATALSLALASGASAQNETIDEVVVSGQRLSIQTAQDIKQNADQIVDSIVAVDISALPDRSVTETLQRIPGVAIDHLFNAKSTNRFSAEGSGVVIRGLTQVRSELNGRDVFSARNTRGLSFEDVPSELMAGIDVFKNPSAELIEGGIAGTVNLRTRRPFDSEGFVAGFTASANYGDFMEETKPQASLVLSNRWDTGIGEFGVLFNAAYSELATRTDSIQFGRPFRRAASDLGATNAPSCEDMRGGTFDCVFVPAGARWSELDFERERRGGAIALQWRPSDRVEANLQVLHSDYTMEWTEHSAWFQGWAYSVYPAQGTNLNFSPDGLFRSGRLVSSDGDYSWLNDVTADNMKETLQPGGAHIPTGSTTRVAETNQKTTDFAFNFRFDVTDRLSVSADLQYVGAEANATDFTVNTAVWPNSLDVDLNGGLPRVAASPGEYLADPANYYWAAGMDDVQINTGQERAGRLDVSYDIDTGWFKSFRSGVRVTNRNANNRDTGYNWQPITEHWMTDEVNGRWPGQVANLDRHLVGRSSFFTFDNFYRGDAALPGGIWVANEDVVRNLSQNGDLLATAQINGSGWEPAEFTPDDINRQHEETYAAYAMLKFGGDIGAMPLDGNVGVRFVRTETAASGYVQQPDWTEYSDVLGADFVATYGSGASVPVKQEGEYDDVLPSLNIRLRILPDLQWRFAFSKAMARPTFDQLRANVQLGGDVFLVRDETVDPPLLTFGEVRSFTGSGGNPWLKPMRATQYDTSLEWYFAQQGSLTGTLFYKDVKDYFISGTERQEIFGRDWSVTTTVNGDEGVIKGLEVGYSQYYDFLPSFLRGFGIQANFTYVESAGSPGPTAGNTTVPGLPLEGLSKTSYNAALLYQRGPIEARLAYNWRERWLLTTEDDDGKGSVWNDDFGQLDASVFYRVTDNVQVGIEANNLSNSTQRLLIGPYKYTLAQDGGTPAYNVDYIDPRLYRNGWFTFDRRIAATVRVTF